MPPIPFADNFLAGSIISLLFPIVVLVAIMVWYLIAVRRFDGSRPPRDAGLAESGDPGAEPRSPGSAA